MTHQNFDRKKFFQKCFRC